jgi:hypothetical protein
MLYPSVCEGSQLYSCVNGNDLSVLFTFETFTRYFQRLLS